VAEDLANTRHKAHIFWMGMNAFAALAMTVLSGACNQASAQDRCPELARLRSDAAHAAEQMGVPTSERCVEYTYFSVAWGAIARYANDHRELCGISALSLDEIDKRHREAIRARENVCAGRAPSISARSHSTLIAAEDQPFLRFMSA
jgi:hypothetical protein